MLKKIGALAILGFAIVNLTGCWDLPIDPYPGSGGPPTGDSTGGGVIDSTWTGGGIDSTGHGGGIDSTNSGRGGGIDSLGGGGIMPGDTLFHDPADSLGLGGNGGGRGPHRGRGPRRG